MKNNLSNEQINQNSKNINKNNDLTHLLGDDFMNLKINYHIKEQDLINNCILSNINIVQANKDKITNLKSANNFNYDSKLSKINTTKPSHNISFKLEKNFQFSNKILNNEDLKIAKDNSLKNKDILKFYKKESKPLLRNKSTKDIKKHDSNIFNKNSKININQNNNSQNNINYYLKNIQNSKRFQINNKFLKNYSKKLHEYIIYENNKKNSINNSLNIDQGNSRNRLNIKQDLILSFNKQYFSSNQKIGFSSINKAKNENKFCLNNKFFNSKSLNNQTSNSRKIMQLKSPKSNELVLKGYKTPMYNIRKKLFKINDISLTNKIKLNSKSTREYMKQNEVNKNNSEINFYINEKEKNKNFASINVIKQKEIIKGYFAISQPGKDKNFFRKINQDYYIIETNINGIQNFNLFGVLDGHGLYGHLISLFVGKYISNTLINHTEIKSCSDLDELYFILKNNNFNLINEIFVNAEKELYNEEFDSNFSGTTCIIVIQLGQKLICANSGDSRAILIYNEKEQFDNGNSKDFETNFYQIKNIIAPFSTYNINFKDSSKRHFLSRYEHKKLRQKIYKSFKLDKKIKNLENIKTSIFCLSNDLKPTLPLEKQRIIENGGKVEQYIDSKGKAFGPYRVWVQDEMFPGLAMSRSIGDFIATSVGVIPNPEIIEYNLNKGSKYMIIASDGIWQYMSNEKVMNIGNQYYPIRDPIDMCNELVKEANNCWDNQGIPTDDITLLVVYF